MVRQTYERFLCDLRSREYWERSGLQV